MDAHTHPVWAGERVHEFAMKVIAMNDCKSKMKHKQTDKSFSKESVGCQSLQHRFDIVSLLMCLFKDIFTGLDYGK